MIDADKFLLKRLNHRFWIAPGTQIFDLRANLARLPAIGVVNDQAYQ